MKKRLDLKEEKKNKISEEVEKIRGGGILNRWEVGEGNAVGGKESIGQSRSQMDEGREQERWKGNSFPVAPIRSIMETSKPGTSDLQNVGNQEGQGSEKICKKKRQRSAIR